MSCGLTRLQFAFCFALLALVGFGVCARPIIGQPSDLQVLNVNTGMSYSGIQEALDASETLDGHAIRVGVGVFFEHVTVNKSVLLEGESRYESIIDGGGAGTVIYVTANEVEVRNLSIRNGTFGLWLHHSNNSRILDNTFSIGSYGIRLYHSRNSSVAGNHVSAYSHSGIELDSSGNSTLRNNIMVNNRYNFEVDGTSLLDFQNDIDVSNTVNGKPARYLINQRDSVIDSSTFDQLGYLGLVNSSNVEVRNLEVEKNGQGVLFAFISNSSISSVNTQDNWNGIYVTHSSNVSVSKVKSTGNFDYGIKFMNSSGCQVFQNDADNNGWAGIGLFKSHNSVLDLNEASFATYDLHLVFTNNSVITRTTALIKPGGYSIALYYSHNNLIYRNTFENSLLFVESRDATGFTPGNTWDDGLEGNCWLSYRGLDADQDGIGDTSYRVGENNVDNRPLMGRFSEFSVILNERVYSVAVVSNSTITEFQFNPDERRISFNAIGHNGTAGFCRVAVSADFLHELEGNLEFLVNGEGSVVVRQWSAEAFVFWYLSFANEPSQTMFDPLFIAVVVLSFLILLSVVLIVFWRRRSRSE